MLRLLLRGLEVWFACSRNKPIQGTQPFLFREFRILPCLNCTSLPITDLLTSLSSKGLWPIPVVDSYGGSVMGLITALRKVGQECLPDGSLGCNTFLHMSTNYAEATYPKGLLLDASWGVNNSLSVWDDLDYALAMVSSVGQNS